MEKFLIIWKGFWKIYHRNPMVNYPNSAEKDWLKFNRKWNNAFIEETTRWRIVFPIKVSTSHKQVIQQPWNNQRWIRMRTALIFAWIGSRLGTSRPRKALVSHSHASTFWSMCSSSKEPPVRHAAYYNQLNSVRGWISWRLIMGFRCITILISHML